MYFTHCYNATTSHCRRIIAKQCQCPVRNMRWGRLALAWEHIFGSHSGQRRDIARCQGELAMHKPAGDGLSMVELPWLIHCMCIMSGHFRNISRFILESEKAVGRLRGIYRQCAVQPSSFLFQRCLKGKLRGCLNLESFWTGGFWTGLEGSEVRRQTDQISLILYSRENVLHY